jgi:hypothetical protein
MAALGSLPGGSNSLQEVWAELGPAGKGVIANSLQDLGLAGKELGGVKRSGGSLRSCPCSVTFQHGC